MFYRHKKHKYSNHQYKWNHSQQAISMSDTCNLNASTQQASNLQLYRCLSQIKHTTHTNVVPCFIGLIMLQMMPARIPFLLAITSTFCPMTVASQTSRFDVTQTPTGHFWHKKQSQMCLRTLWRNK